MESKVLILDFGSQYTQLIARRVRELFIYCEIYPYNNLPKNLDEFNAVILSGSPFSVRSKMAPHPNLDKIKGVLPLLSICYGAQYLAHFYGGNVKSSNTREYGRANLSNVNSEDPFFKDVPINTQVWMSHGDTIEKLPKNSVLLASTQNIENAAFRIEDEITYGIQFHPEVYHSEHGKKILKNFLVDISQLRQERTPHTFFQLTLKALRL